MSVPVVPVVVDGWQYECCGVPPAVGQRVAWHLILLDEDWPEASVDLPVVVEDVPPAALSHWLTVGNTVGPAPAVLRREGVLAYVRDRRTVTGGRARGVLHEDHHVDVPSELPTTAGLVERVRLVSEVFALTGPRTFEAVPGTEELVDVREAPPFLPWDEVPEDAQSYRATTRVLVELAVDPT